ncbi:MAG: hypothetical protein DMG29_09930 [Acidobacteria bacterium]|nr:MAG: hypothetical protein DMG29_09930 [Acidobacteriota bacterium]
MTQGSRGRRRAWIAAAALVVIIAAAWAIRGVGQWLVVQDALEPAQAIVVLSGRMPVRAREAAEIYREGFAAQVWITRPASPEEELRQMGIGFVGEEFYNQRVLIQLGVPTDAIRVLDKPVINTEQEVLEISDALRQEGGSKVIVVTTKPHTRRVKAIWKRLVGNSPRLMVRYASQDGYDGVHWWRRTSDALDVVRELLGLANAWAGFPVQPEKR